MSPYFVISTVIFNRHICRAVGLLGRWRGRQGQLLGEIFQIHKLRCISFCVFVSGVFVFFFCISQMWVPCLLCRVCFHKHIGAQGEGERDREVFSWEDNDCNDNDLNFDDNIEIIFPGCCYISFWASSLASQGRVQPCDWKGFHWISKNRFFNICNWCLEALT